MQFIPLKTVFLCAVIFFSISTLVLADGMVNEKGQIIDTPSFMQSLPDHYKPCQPSPDNIQKEYWYTYPERVVEPEYYKSKIEKQHTVDEPDFRILIVIGVIMLIISILFDRKARKL